jgi:hypothetical protein
MQATDEQTRRKLCTHLGQSVTQERVSHCKWQHTTSLTPPSTPNLPYGSLWSLVNHIKVMHQYTELLSEAATGKGPHSPLLSGSKEMCVGSLSWFLPLCEEIMHCTDDYLGHLDIWRQANPGLFGNDEAAYHVHQSYMVEDRNMTRFLVSLINPHAKEYEVEIAANMLRARPTSFEEFQREFGTWRCAVLYHPLCLAARNMPRVEQWVPEGLLHEADDWQELLDELNRSSFCSNHRLAAVCEALADRSPMLNNHICDVIDKIAILTRVKSNASLDTPNLNDYLPLLQFPGDQTSPYTHCLISWNRMKQTMKNCIPPSLLCPTLYPTNRGAWGYQRLYLVMHNTLQIQPSPFTWIDSLGSKTAIIAPQDRLYDILSRLGDAATSPEIAHLMLDPKSLHDILAGDILAGDILAGDILAGDILAGDILAGDILAGDEQKGAIPDYSDRKYVISRMDGHAPDNFNFIKCLTKIIQSLPASTERDLGCPRQFLAWRIDNPPRAILYIGAEHQIDLASQPPYTLSKTLLQDKTPNRTVSGISILNDPMMDDNGIHASLRACIAEEIVGAHVDFADHPHHKTPVRVAGKTQEIHTTTLAEAVSLFTGPPPEKLSDLRLHESSPWEAGHIDMRYAERQTGDNGSRFRDWATVYRDDDEIQRCRLASHEIRCSKVYETHFPLATATGHAWVSVASTLPTETRVLKHLGGRTGLEVLKRSVESRFMHDGKLLPVRHKDDRVERCNMEIYSDEKAGQVMLAYAPVSHDGEHRSIEFISFQHC